MTQKIYTKRNFHSHTFCIWQEVSSETVRALSIDYRSKSGSEYIFTQEGVYRISNHWGRAANCRWRLEPLDNYKSQDTKIGFALWTDFYPNDDSSKLFYIRVNFEAQTVTFHHKDAPNSENNAAVRNAAETARTIRAIKQVLTETDWAKHLKFDDFTAIKQQIINELISTERSFLEIKKQYL